MNNKQLVQAFLKGETSGMNSTKTLAIRPKANGYGTELVNYSTVIAGKGELGTVFVSKKAYSPTTGKIQRMIKDEAVIFTEVPHGFLNRHEFAGRDSVGTKVTV